MLVEILFVSVCYFYAVLTAGLFVLPKYAGEIGLGGTVLGLLIFGLALFANWTNQGRVSKGGYVTDGGRTRWDPKLRITGNSRMSDKPEYLETGLTPYDLQINSRLDRVLIICIALMVVLVCSICALVYWMGPTWINAG